MSHMTTVNTEIRDVKALSQAAKALGLELLKGGQARGYDNRLYEEADYLIKLPGTLDLGFRKQADGTYSFECDNGLMYGMFGSTEGYNIIGEKANRLKIEYSFAVLQANARKRGRRIQREELPNGSVRVVISGGR